jgi:transcriptional regulator with XRE-family HTH domain
MTFVSAHALPGFAGEWLKSWSIMQKRAISKLKEWAKQLFTRNDLSQKEIALKVGVSEKTMSQWVTTEHWDAMRKTLLTTKAEILKHLYDKMQKLAQEEDSEDKLVKTAASIKKLETETGIGEAIDILESLTSFVLNENWEEGQIINKWGAVFIKDKLESFK